MGFACVLAVKLLPQENIRDAGRKRYCQREFLQHLFWYTFLCNTEVLAKIPEGLCSCQGIGPNSLYAE